MTSVEFNELPAMLSCFSKSLFCSSILWAG